jgi:peptide/nickel transport system permease protein
MIRFLIRRVLFGALVLLLISIAVYLLFYVVQGSPEDVARNFAGRQATPEQVRNVAHRLWLDRPWYESYFHFLSGLVRFDFGTSFRNQTSVTSMLLSRLPVTASLAIGAAIIWLVMGVLIGVLAAVRPRSIFDRLATLFALLFLSMPTFVVGLIAIFVLFFKFTTSFGITFFPPSGYVSLTSNPWEWFRHLLMPWFTVALVSAASYSRLTRGSLLEVLGEDYIRTARAKGLPERRVIFRHGLRSALTPIVTLFGIDLGTLLGGAIVTEAVFGLPGVGVQAVTAVDVDDLPVIVGTVMFAAFFIVAANIIVDIVYAVLDARVRLA